MTEEWLFRTLVDWYKLYPLVEAWIGAFISEIIVNEYIFLYRLQRLHESYFIIVTSLT